MNDQIRITDLKKKNSIGRNYTYFVPLHNTLKAMLPDNLEPNCYIIGGMGKPMNRTSFNKLIQHILNELFNADLDIDNTANRVVIHTFRHTFGSWLAIAGTPIYTIKKLMNHENIEQTMRYAKLAPDQGFDAVRSLPV
jgi:integrase